MSDLSGAACVGDWDLFDSTEPEDHAEARHICQECPVRLACSALLAHERRSGGGGLTGTWAGDLFIRGKAAQARVPLAVVSSSPERRHWHNLPDCDHCGAKTGEPCQAPSGSQVAAHRARLKVGCQDCGVEIGPRKRICSECRHQRDLISWRESYRRKKEGAA